jgi:protein O-GlcNAc transferase
VAGVDELFSRAVAAQRDGDLIAAERDYRQILAINPQHALALSNLGVILGRRGELAEAMASAENASKADPNLAVAHFNLGNIYRRVNRPGDAVKSYQRVLQLTPGFAPGHLTLGIVRGELGDWPAAAEHFRRAIDLQPGIADGLYHLGEALTHLGEMDRAIITLRESLNQSPNLPRNYLSLARALFSAGQIDEAIPTVEHALRLQPQHAVAHNYLGILLEKAGRFDEAQTHFREAVRIRPDFAGAWNNLGLNLHGQGFSPEAAESFAKSLDLSPDPLVASNRLVALLDSSLTPENLLQEHTSWAAKYASDLQESVGKPPPFTTGRRLKIGYLIGELKSSVTARFLEALLLHHDRQKLHITCYSNVQQAGVATDLLGKLVDVWLSIAGIDDAAAAERIRADENDILVDLNGHTAGNRLLVFARQPAHVSMSLFGYPATTGLKAIGYRITDDIAAPSGSVDGLSVEKMIRMPDIGRVYVPPSFPTPLSTLPAAGQKRVTFGCLNRPGKLSNVCVETWAKILLNIPNSRLVLQAGRSQETARRLNDRFSRLGVDSNRLVLVYMLPEQDYFEVYQAIDLTLDPFPFNGRATSCDALWMGVPVLSVAGNDCRSRQGLSILSSIGLTDFVADSPEKLIALASVWAAQIDTLAELRSSLREMMKQSPLTDAQAYVRNLEAAYFQVVAPR